LPLADYAAALKQFQAGKGYKIQILS